MTIPSAGSARGVGANRGEAMETKLTQLSPAEPRRGLRRARASVVISVPCECAVSTTLYPAPRHVCASDASRAASPGTAAGTPRSCRESWRMVSNRSSVLAQPSSASRSVLLIRTRRHRYASPRSLTAVTAFHAQPLRDRNHMAEWL